MRYITEIVRARLEAHYDQLKRDVRLSPEKANTADNWHDLGLELQNRHDHLNARACYEKACELNVKHIKALCALASFHEEGLAYLEESLLKAEIFYRSAALAGNYEAALKFLNFNKTLGGPTSWSSLGHSYHYPEIVENRNYFIARACYEKSLELYPNETIALYNLAILHEHGLGSLDADIPEAKKLYLKAAENCNHYESAVKYFELEPLSLDADGLDSLGLEYYRGSHERKKSYTMAQACFEKSIRLNPELQKAFYHLAIVLDNQDKMSEAKLAYEKAAIRGCLNSVKRILTLDNPKLNVRKWTGLGLSYFNRDKFKTRACLELALNLDPKANIAHLYLGILHENAFGGLVKNLELAKQHYLKSALEANDEAADHFIRLDNPTSPQTADYWNSLGLDYRNATHGKTSSPTLAKACFKKAHELGHDEARLELALLSNPKLNIMDWTRYAKRLYGEGRYPNARDIFKLVLKLDPHHHEANYFLGKIYENGYGAEVDFLKIREYYIRSRPLCLPIIDALTIKLLENVGRGNYGNLKHAKWNSVDVAVKSPICPTTESHTITRLELLDIFEREACQHAKLRHPNIVTFYGVSFLNKGEYSIVMELMVKASLYDLLYSTQELPWALRLRIAIDIAHALLYLHQQYVLHCDLKSSNILLDSASRAKVSDFGTYKDSSQNHFVKTEGICSTHEWAAPELYTEDGSYSTASDIFSLGVIFGELATREKPSSAMPTIPVETPSSLAGLIARCWNADRTKRPSDIQAEIINPLAATLNFLEEAERGHTRSP